MPAKPVTYTRLLALFLLAAFIAFPNRSLAIWVVNFGTARTLAPGRIGFAAGMGGQIVLLGEPRQTSAFFTIPHAGFRYGLAPRLDMGLRLAPIPLPFSTVGPGFGVNVDAKYRLSNLKSKFDFALMAGLGGAHVLIEGATRTAYSPNGAVLATYNRSDKLHITAMGRYVHLAIPTAADGAAGNFVNIAGVSLGVKKDIRPNISILPEIGAYHYDGKVRSIGKRGPGFQYGFMIAATF